MHAVDEPVRLDALRGVRITAAVPLTDGTVVCALADGSVLRYDQLESQIVFELPAGSVPDPVLARYGGDGFMTAEPDGRVRRWSADGHELPAVPTGVRPLSLSVSAADRWALLSDDGTVTLGSGTEDIAGSRVRPPRPSGWNSRRTGGGWS